MKLDSVQGETSRAGLRHRLCVLATTCFSTFDVPSEHIPATLVNEGDFSIAMQCAVIVHDNTPPSLSDDDSFYLPRMLSRHLRLLHHLEPVFGRSLPPIRGQARLELLHSAAYDHALARMWLGYHRHNPLVWYSLPGLNSRWISCKTEKGREVHYNLLSGELLISGKHLGRLPQEIVGHPTYVSLLGMVSDQS